MTGKAVLAFSGGLDTSVVVKYLQEEHDMDVVTVTVDVGQGEDSRAVHSKAKKLGVKKHHTIDARKEFVAKYVIPSIKANALYQKKYCLATALARPLIAQKMLEVAKKEGATALAHGCSGKGNDQVRFDITLRSGSALPIIAPIRDKNLDRTTELAFAKRHGINIESVAKKYSIDQNLWGRAIEGGVIEDAYKEPPSEAFIWVKTKNLPDRPAYVEIEFAGGVPVRADKIRGAQEIIQYLNKKAGGAGVGIIDHIEDRVVGIKSREVYETPAALCLIEAHSDLEKMVHTSHQNRFKGMVDEQWAHLAYSGLWQDPLRADLDGFINESQKSVSGTVRLKLYKGSMRVVGRKSSKSLYIRDTATYGAESTFDQRLAVGFVELWGMQSTEANKLQKKRSKKI
ncbi:MAG: argininosuccinate synthase [Nitrosopumilus sp. B06]|nr:MAG: argininosuccinate synthase [Nitrosopumilus sp. D6]RNJ78599.1 MAG: argininosuccinate synthase [Nitrosopumilus sp. B06]